MRSGETLARDLIVLATRYKGSEHLAGKLLRDRCRHGSLTVSDI
jgi:hypothetical protein